MKPVTNSTQITITDATLGRIETMSFADYVSTECVGMIPEDIESLRQTLSSLGSFTVMHDDEQSIRETLTVV